MKKFYLLVFIVCISHSLLADYSIARRWNEVMLMAIRQDLARPPVQARNLFHFSLAMYEAWAAYDPKADQYVLGRTFGNTTYAYNGTAPLMMNDTVASQQMAISYAVYRLLVYRFSNSPNAIVTKLRFDTLMNNLGYDINYTSVNYQNGTPADFGNYIGQKIIQFGLGDGSNEIANYSAIGYAPVNPPLVVDSFGNPNMVNPNRWQQMTIQGALDQGGNPIPSTPAFIGPEWGNVRPFSMSNLDLTMYFRSGFIYNVYKNPGTLPLLHMTNRADSSSQLFKWGHTMVSIWSSHLDPDDTTMIDISPAHTGNVNLMSSSIFQSQQYYNYFNGGDTGKGYAINPVTNLPYTSNLIKRGDYTRVASQFWADGPHSETPPGHWFVLLNDVGDHPLFTKRFQGVGDVVDNLEWDIKSYFVLGSAMHDAAIAAWSVKGWYDSPRPISAIRKMAEYGQSSDSTLPHFHPGGLPLIPGYIELVTAGDSLAGVNNEFLNKIKIKSWRGFKYIADSSVDVGKVGWILAESWMPYQRKTFVTPPFAGYVSGHSTYSRAGAEVMTLLTGSNYFPGGLAEYEIPANSGFLVIEKGPSTNVKLQWATYQDASNEASLSRIWGGIHPPFDDIPGRLIGRDVGIASFNLAKQYFNETPFPLTFHSFVAVEKDCKIILDWETSAEKNVESFVVYHSNDGKNYSRIVGTVKANNKYSKNEYQLTDTSTNVMNYYKLVEQDIDHKNIQLGTASIKNSCQNILIEDQIAVYPNPFDKQFNITISTNDIDQNASYNIVNALGRTVYTSSIALLQKQTSIQINLNTLPTGIYTLNINFENGKNFVRKLIKQ